MACGDTLLHLLRTPEGRTPDDPCGLFCWEGDDWTWINVVRGVGIRTEREWNNLLAAEKRSGGGTNTSETLRPQVEQFMGAIKDLPSWLEVMGSGGLPATIRERVNTTIGIGQEGICVLENVQAAVASVGGRPTVIPGQGGSSDLWPVALAGVAILGALGLVAWNVNQSRRAA